MTQEFRQLQGKISEVRKRLKWIIAAKGLAISMALSLAVWWLRFSVLTTGITVTGP